MEPFTLEWWILQLRVSGRLECYYDAAREIITDELCEKKSERYGDLSDFIEQRIIDEYGE